MSIARKYSNKIWIRSIKKEIDEIQFLNAE